MSTASIVVGVDVGGTFTDVFVLDETKRELRIAKVASTPDDPSQGFVTGIAAAVAEFAAIASVVHGTTVGTNALLERKGAKTGIITTTGFRDVLEMRRRDRPTTWGLRGSFEPVVQRELRLEVDERTLADGTVRQAIDPQQVAAATARLTAMGCDSVCVFFINGYANASNERAAVEVVRSLWPTPYVTVATEILPEIREFERCSTATLNAYLQPVVAGYLDRLEQALESRGGRSEVLIVQSNGGVMAVETAKRLPIRTALSGPAAGVIAARHIARAAGFDNIVSCDMGGTSFDVSLVADGESTLSAQTQIDFGLVVRTPMIEITTIGAGGGSIARVDDGGLLEVGPESAGSDPGPVCYGLGNPQPTVTDANLVLGRINPERPIGGALSRLHIDAARAAIDRHIADPLGLPGPQAADAIVRLANAKMAGAIRLVSIERGHDPKRFAAMPFGGGGALHTGALMNEIGLAAALVPRYPGVTSALGCVVADMRHDVVQTINTPLDSVDSAALGRRMQALADEAEHVVQRTGATLRGIDRHYELDMLYLGQTHTVAVPIILGSQTLTRQAMESAFEQSYRAAFGRLLDGIPMRVMNCRVAVVGRRPGLDMSLLAPCATRSVEQCRIDQRRVWADGDWRDTAVYERLQLPVGAEIAGPALLEQPDSTVFIDPGLSGRVDDHGNLVITRSVA